MPVPKKNKLRAHAVKKNLRVAAVALDELKKLPEHDEAIKVLDALCEFTKADKKKTVSARAAKLAVKSYMVAANSS